MKWIFRISLKSKTKSPSMRREWIEIRRYIQYVSKSTMSPSMRREWIEMPITLRNILDALVSLHAEGVD